MLCFSDMYKERERETKKKEGLFSREFDLEICLEEILSRRDQDFKGESV